MFVFSGILPITQSDSGLAAVLGHEIAHNLAHHAAERMSTAIIGRGIFMALQLGYTLLTGDSSGAMGDYLGRMALDLGFMRPGSRKQESEADYIGLMMMSEACYDPEAAVGLWERMEQAQKDAPPEFLSTHPSNTNRVAKIKQWMTEAEAKREGSGCEATRQQYQGFANARKALA